jgi:hypothetical protein
MNQDADSPHGSIDPMAVKTLTELLARLKSLPASQNESEWNLDQIMSA